MKPSHAIVAAALLAACAPAMQSATAPAAQRAFVGVWKGMGTQSDQPDSIWSITAAITGGQPGAVVGTIAYPSLACGGELVLVGATADSLVVREHITFGDCIDGGITFAWRSPGYLDYRWRSATSDVTARGQLGPANQ